LEWKGGLHVYLHVGLREVGVAILASRRPGEAQSGP